MMSKAPSVTRESAAATFTQILVPCQPCCVDPVNGFDSPVALANGIVLAAPRQLCLQYEALTNSVFSHPQRGRYIHTLLIQ